MVRVEEIFVIVDKLITLFVTDSAVFVVMGTAIVTVATGTKVIVADVVDVVLVAGKGHESTQEIKGKKFDFSDQEHVLLAAGGMAWC